MSWLGCLAAAHASPDFLSTNHEIEIFSVVVAGTPFRTFHYTLEKIMIFLSF